MKGNRAARRSTSPTAAIITNRQSTITEGQALAQQFAARGLLADVRIAVRQLRADLLAARSASDRATTAQLCSSSGCAMYTALSLTNRSSTTNIVVGTDDPTTETSNRLALSQSFYDEMGRAWKTQRHKIDDADGSDDDNLQTLIWYDAA